MSKQSHILMSFKQQHLINNTKICIVGCASAEVSIGYLFIEVALAAHL